MLKQERKRERRGEKGSALVIIVFRRKHAVKYRVARPPDPARYHGNVAARRRRGVASGVMGLVIKCRRVYGKRGSRARCLGATLVAKEVRNVGGVNRAKEGKIRWWVTRS